MRIIIAYIGLGTLAFLLLLISLYSIYIIYLKFTGHLRNKRRKKLWKDLHDLKFCEWKDDLFSSDSCTHCLELFSTLDYIAILNCQHGIRIKQAYHIRCLEKWIRSGSLICGNCFLEIVPKHRNYSQDDLLRERWEESSSESQPLLQKSLFNDIISKSNKGNLRSDSKSNPAVALNLKSEIGVRSVAESTAKIMSSFTLPETFCEKNSTPKRNGNRRHSTTSSVYYTPQMDQVNEGIKSKRDSHVEVEVDVHLTPVKKI